MASKTNKGLIEYCKAQVGRPYFYGTFGNKASRALYNQKKEQYPKFYTWDYSSKYDGQRVHDCAGLIKGYLWSETPDSPPKYNAKEDYGATAFYQHCTKKGTLASFDRIPGRLVFKGTPSKMSHVGVYIGDDRIIEAKGHAYGVIESRLDDKWTHWGQCNLIQEDAAPAPDPEPIPTPAPTPSPSPAPEPASNEYRVKTNGSPLALRRSPNPKGALICWMANGSKVTVSGTNGSWSRTTYKGMTGWAYTKWIAKA